MPRFQEKIHEIKVTGTHSQDVQLYCTTCPWFKFVRWGSTWEQMQDAVSKHRAEKNPHFTRETAMNEHYDSFRDPITG